jgi:hypothetical protein
MCVVLIMYRWCLLFLLFLVLLLLLLSVFVVDKAIIININVIISPKLGLEKHEYIQREQT